MSNTYNVTFRFHLPIRSDKTVTVQAKDEDEAVINGRLEAVKQYAMIFSDLDYSEVPHKVEQI